MMRAVQSEASSSFKMAEEQTLVFVKVLEPAKLPQMKTETKKKMRRRVLTLKTQRGVDETMSDIKYRCFLVVLSGLFETHSCNP